MSTPHAPLRLIAIDLDGTLLGPEGRVSPRNRDTLIRAQDAGIEIVIATGRRHTFAMSVIDTLALAPSNAVISSNGTVIRSYAGELLQRNHLSAATTRWLIDYCDRWRSSMMLTFDTLLPDGQHSAAPLVCEEFHDLRDSIGEWMRSNRNSIRHVGRLEDAIATDDDAPIQMMMCGTSAHIDAIRAHLLASGRVVEGIEPTTAATEIVLHRTAYPDRDLVILDILPVGVSKASALAALAERRGIPTASIAAIGDNWNDVPMLSFAGHAFLMGNASADLKAFAQPHGWAVVPSNHEDGVAVALDQILAAHPSAPMVVS